MKTSRTGGLRNQGAFATSANVLDPQRAAHVAQAASQRPWQSAFDCFIQYCIELQPTIEVYIIQYHLYYWTRILCPAQVHNVGVSEICGPECGTKNTEARITCTKCLIACTKTNKSTVSENPHLGMTTPHSVVTRPKRPVYLELAMACSLLLAYCLGCGGKQLRDNEHFFLHGHGQLR